MKTQREKESKPLTTKNFAGQEWKLPYRGRFGCEIEHTLSMILRHPEGIALYAAQDLRGSAKNYSDRYRAAFARFAAANSDKLEAGSVGPRGGFGYRVREATLMSR